MEELVPAPFTADDPAPERTTLLRLHVDRMTGCAATAASP
jgi:hypothetical protein